MRPLPPAAVFTVADLEALRWTLSARRHAVQTRRIARVRHGVYCAGPATPRILALAAAAAYPRATVSHRSGLLLHDLPWIGASTPVPEMTVAPRASLTMPDTHVYRATTHARRRTVVDGAAVTTVARTLVDVGRNFGLDSTVAAIDAALHGQLVVAADIEMVLLEQRNWPGVERARQSFALSDGRAESPLESISRLAFPRLGLPSPLPQVDVFDRSGAFIGRSDFGWIELGVVGEADGLLKYRNPDDREVLVREKLRQEALERTGLAVARWGWAEASRDQGALRRRVLAAFERARARDRAGLPRTWVLRPAACASPTEAHGAAFTP